MSIDDNKKLPKDRDLSQITIDALIESEQSYRILAETASDVIIKIDAESRILFVNHACERIFGYTPQEMVGQSLTMIMPENMRDNHLVGIKNYIQNNIKKLPWESMEVPARHKDGRIFPLEMSFGEFKSAGGHFFIGTGRDVSKRKEAEKEKAHLAAIVETSDDAIISKNLDGIVTSWNKSAERMFGYSAEEMVGNPILILIPAHLKNEEPAILSRIKKGEKVKNYESIRQCKNGSLINVSLTISPIKDRNGKIIGASKIVRDITEQKKAEQALNESRMMLSLAMQSSKMGVWELDIATNAVIWSEELEEIFGLKKGTFPGTRAAYYELVHEDDRERIFNEVQTAIVEKRSYSIELRFYHSDGTIRWMEGRGQAVYSETGEPVRVYGIGIDITERKNSEQQLSQSEERFRTLFNSIDEGFCIVEVIFNSDNKPVDYRFIQANPAMARLTGLTNAIGKTARELVPNLESFWFETYGKVALTGESVRFENYSEPMGRWFDVYASRLGDSETHQVAIVFNNITDRKRIEENLRESEDRFRNMADNISQFAWMTDEKGSIFWYNRRWYEYTGTTFEEMQGWGWKAVHHPDEVDRVVEKFWSSIAQGKPWEDTFPLRSKTGEYRWFLSRALPIHDQNGKVIRWFGTNTDITELREAQEALRESELRFRGLQQATPDGFMIFESVRDENQKIVDFKWIYVNPAAEKIVGLSESQLVGKNLLDILPGNRDEGLFDAYLSVVEKGELWQKEFEYSHEHLNHHFLSTAVKVGDGFAVAFSNITERKRIELEREELLERERLARIEAETANRAKDEFLSVLSHELRTPLNSILGWTRMLKSGLLDDIRTQQAVETIERNARLQNNLIEDLLDVSRIISGRINLEEEEVDFIAVINSAIESVQPLADGKKIYISFISEAKSVKLLGDATRLQQIVVNLTNNAIKFTPENGNVNLDLSHSEDYLILKITDTGIGISSEFLPYIFDRFRQADSTTRRHHSGLGLGLTIVSHLTELHGGKISAHSDGKDKGSIFTLQLPLNSNKFTAREILGSTDTSTNNDSNHLSLQNKSILLVDDDCDGILPVQMFLEKQGAEVHCANTAREAMEKLEEQNFDLIISDIGMPEIDGYNLIVRIRKTDKHKDIPAIALTAYASVQDRERALFSGFQHHLAKPVDFERLLQTILNVLNEPKIK